jgi:drug/metabolite transporter (DMT)-like permease
MLWFVLALATAFFSAGEAVLFKRFFGDRPPYEMIVWPMAWSLPLFAGYLLLSDAPEVQQGFWSVMAVMLPLNMAAFLIQTWAIRLSPISLTVPFLSFTPAFMLGTGYVILGEAIPVQGVAGIACIVAGSWLLNRAPAASGRTCGAGAALLEPFRAVYREKGSMLMLLAAFIWSLTAVLSKKLALLGTPMLLLIFGFTRVSPRCLRERPLAGAALGVCMFGQIVFHYLAITLVAAAYMIAVKRLNGVISVAFGRLVFGERVTLWRTAGACVMGAGAAMIALAG